MRNEKVIILDNQELPDLNSTDRDLLYISKHVGVQVAVHDVVYDLIGEISSSSDDDELDEDDQLEQYLFTNLKNLNQQVMARTKQTERKEQNDRQQRQSGGGHQLATLQSPRRSPRLLDSDSSLEAVAVFYSVVDEAGLYASMGKKSPRKCPASTGFTLDEGSTSEGLGRQKRRRITNEEDINENPPVLKSQRSTGDNPTPTKGGKPGASKAGLPKNTGGKPGAAKADPPKNTGGKSGALRADPQQHVGGKPAGKMQKKISKKPSKPRHQMTMKELCADWNRTGRCGLPSETLQGWLKKTEKKREDQKKVLKRAKPGAKALREIRHYQRCQTFLIAVLPFQRLIREISLNSPFSKEGMRWQSNALFSLQSSAEAYMAGYFHDVNLCACHHKVITINRQDVWIVISIRGCEHVGGRCQVSDVGSCNVSGFTIADAAEKKIVPRGARTAFAQEPDWCAELRKSVAVDADDGGKKGTKGSTVMKRRHWVLKNSIHCISKSAFCHLACREGVERISGNVFEESRGVLKVFLEAVIKDAIVYARYCLRKMVTMMDVIYTLKLHGHNLYGFTRLFSYSCKVDKNLPGSKPQQ